eukprot:bmy_06696T0
MQGWGGLAARAPPQDGEDGRRPEDRLYCESAPRRAAETARWGLAPACTVDSGVSGGGPPRHHCERPRLSPWDGAFGIGTAVLRGKAAVAEPRGGDPFSVVLVRRVWYPTLLPAWLARSCDRCICTSPLALGSRRSPPLQGRLLWWPGPQAG